jgi:very-short-patch-repair endonuclease
MPRKTRGTTISVIVGAARSQRKEPTTAESRLWEALRSRSLTGLKFRRQHPVGSFILDFYCTEQNLCIEVDGEIHNQPEQVILDAQRTSILKQLGIHILRFTNTEINENMDQVMRKILQYIQSKNEDPF